MTELRRHERWGSVFFTLKDPGDGNCLPASIPRRTFDALDLGLADGERVHVFGRPELFAGRAEFRLRALSIERFGEGAHLAALERLKRRLAAEGLFATQRKRPLPRLPRRIGIVTGSDAAARGDLVATISHRFPPARILIAETLVQGPRAAAGIVAALQALCREPEIDVVVVARGGGSLEDLLPFSDEAVVRAIAACPVPVVSAVGHEQDTPLCDLAADARASTPTAAARLVVPDVGELHARVARAHAGLERGARRLVERDGQRLQLVARAPAARARAARGAPPLGPRPSRRPAARALAACDARARLRDRPGGGGARHRGGWARDAASVSTSSSPPAPSRPPWRRCGRSDVAHLRGGARGARGHRRAARARADGPRRGAHALGAWRGAASRLPRAARCRRTGASRSSPAAQRPRAVDPRAQTRKTMNRE